MQIPEKLRGQFFLGIMQGKVDVKKELRFTKEQWAYMLGFFENNSIFMKPYSKFLNIPLEVIEEGVKRFLKNPTFENNVEEAVTYVGLSNFVIMDAFDARKITGEIKVRRAKHNEIFEGKKLEGTEYVLVDDEKILSIYCGPHTEKIALKPGKREIIVIAYGVKGVEKSRVENALKEFVSLLNPQVKAIALI